MACPTHLEMLIAQSGSKIGLGLSVYNSLQILQLKTYKPHTHAVKSLSSAWLGEPTKPKHSTETQQKNGHQMGYEKRTDSLGGVGPCTARNLFEIASGRSRGPFPYRSLLKRCQLPSFYVIMCWFWHHQNPGALQVSSTRYSSDGLPQPCLRAPASCTETF